MTRITRDDDMMREVCYPRRARDERGAASVSVVVSYVFYSKRVSASRPAFTRVHSDAEDFSAASALALASANAFFFAADTLGITEPGFFLPSGSSYFLSR